MLHGHPPGIAIYLTDAHLRFTYRDGRAEEGHVKAGAAVPTALEEHIPENLGDMPVWSENSSYRFSSALFD